MAFYFYFSFRNWDVFVQPTYFWSAKKRDSAFGAHGLQILIPVSEWLAGDSGGFMRQLQRKWGRGTFSSAIWGPVSSYGSRKASKIYLSIFFPKTGPAL